MHRSFENLEGQTRGTLLISRIARSQPLAWHCRCSICGTEQVQSHTDLQREEPKCRFSGCRKEPTRVYTSGAAQVAVRETASRSADSARLARERAAEEQGKVRLIITPEAQAEIDFWSKTPSGARS